MNKKLIVIIGAFVAGFVLIIAAYLIWYNYSVSTFIVTTSRDAKIYVKQDSDNFTEIGTTSATYKTHSESVVFFEARLNDQVSQKTYSPKRHTTQTVELKFQPLISAQLFAQGSLINMFIENGFIYGINPHTNSLATFPVLPSQATSPTVPLLPFLKQVIWKDSKNFYAVTLGRGTQVVENNKTFDGGLLPYGAIAKGRENSILVGSSAYYFSQNTNLNKTTKLSDFVKNSEPNVFADSNFLYSVNLINNDIKSENDTPTAKETNIVLYDQNGKQTNNFTLPITDKIYKLLSLNQNTLVALTNNKLNIVDINTKKITEKEFSFGEVKDMVLYNNKLLLLGTDGLWQYNYNEDQYIKVATYPNTQQYVAGSLIVLNNSLFFSTSATKEAIKNQSGSNVTNAIYKISF